MSLIPRGNLFDIDRFLAIPGPRPTSPRAMRFAPRVDIKEANNHMKLPQNCRCGEGGHPRPREGRDP